MASEDRWRAARRLFENTGADAEWIAGALGVGPARLEAVARRDGWERRPDGLEGTIDRLLGQMSAQLRLFEHQAESADGLSKPQLDALLAITRTFDRLNEMKRAEEARRAALPDRGELERAREAVDRRVAQLTEQRAANVMNMMRAPETDDGGSAPPPGG